MEISEVSLGKLYAFSRPGKLDKKEDLEQKEAKLRGRNQICTKVSVKFLSKSGSNTAREQLESPDQRHLTISTPAGKLSRSQERTSPLLLPLLHFMMAISKSI